MKYTSTRDNSIRINASEAILKGLSVDGGLFVPLEIPKIEKPFSELKDLSYKELAYEVMKLYFDDFSEEELKSCISGAYDEKFDTPLIAPTKKVGNKYVLELWHGKTIAFKDMALSILPHLMVTSAKKNNAKNKIVILTATSGDTGGAALAGFSNVENTEIIVFYPKDGVSRIQEKQMRIQDAKNTHVVAIHGNFDDAQTGVKDLFNNEELNKKLLENGYQFSSANSINIGRLVPQIVYYFYSYLNLLKDGEIKEGEKLNFVVPTGNFGNILAAYYAKEMGLPINKLICASNENKVLFDFFETKEYDRNREFILTNSPSMDILISSNLERLIYRLAGNSSEKTNQLMNKLKVDGKYKIDEDMKTDDFYGNFATEEEVANTIRKTFEKENYLLDTHTAVAVNVYDKYLSKTGDETKTVIASTASPYKFTRSVMDAIDSEKYGKIDDFSLVDKIYEISNMTIPAAIDEIKRKEVCHNTVTTPEKMQDVVLCALNIK